MTTNESPTNKWAYPELVEEVLENYVKKSSIFYKNNDKEITEADYKILIDNIINRNKRGLSGKISDYHLGKLHKDSVKYVKNAVSEAYFEIRGRMNTEEGRANMTRALKNRFEKNKRSASRRRHELSAARKRNAGKKTKSRTRTPIS